MARSFARDNDSSQSHIEVSNFTSIEDMTNFLDLPRELRDHIYGLCLLHQEPINPWHRLRRWSSPSLQEKLTAGLLRVNKIVHREASSFLYSRNIFDFTVASPAAEIAVFLEIIGRTNAAHIQHIHLDFPNFQHLDMELGNLTLDEDSNTIMANVKESCTNLSTVTTPLDSTDFVMSQLTALDHPKIVTEALELVNSHLRAIASLQDIVVEVFENGQSQYIQREMEGLGWTVKTTEYEEEDDWGDHRSLGDNDDYWDRDDGYDDEEDDYDIDNDSDFWRRAQD